MDWQTVGFKLKYQKTMDMNLNRDQVWFYFILIYTRTCGGTAPASVRHESIPVNIDSTPTAGSLWSGSHDSLTPPSVDFQPLDFLRPCQEAAVDVCEIPRVHREQNGGGGGWTFGRRTRGCGSDWGGGLQIALPVYLTSFFEGKQICHLLWRRFTQQLINICTNMSVQICLVTLMFSLRFFFFFCQTRFVFF